MESRLALLQLFLCGKENPVRCSNCFLSLGLEWRRKAGEFSNHLAGLAVEQWRVAFSDCPTIKVYAKSRQKQNISSEGQETTKRGGFSVPLRGFLLGLCFHGHGYLIHKVATLARWGFCGFWGLKRPHANSKTAHRTFFQTPDLGSASQTPLQRFEILDSVSGAPSCAPAPEASSLFGLK